MSAILAWLLSNPTVAALIAAAIAALGIGFQQRRAGAKAERDRQAAGELAARDLRDRVDNDVGALTPEQRREALKRWSA